MVTFPCTLTSTCSHVHARIYTDMHPHTCRNAHTLSPSHTQYHTYAESHILLPLSYTMTHKYTLTVLTHSHSFCLGTRILPHTNIHTFTHTRIPPFNMHSYTLIGSHTHIHTHTSINTLCSVSEVPHQVWILGFLTYFCSACNPPSLLTHLEKRPIPNPLLWRRAGRVIAFI